MLPMSTLDESVKLFVVKQLACFNTPKEVICAVKDEFGIDVNRNQITAYDPTKAKGKNLGKKYVTIFNATRKRLLEELSDLPLANTAVRVAELSKLYYIAKSRGNSPLAAQHLEQIAKEVGGKFTNKLKLAGGGNKPIHTEVSVTTSRIDALKFK